MRKHPALLCVSIMAGLILWAHAPEALASAGSLHEQAEGIGRVLGGVWAVPFAGMLLSIAVFPLLAPSFWSQHFGKVSAFWALAYLAPFVALHGWELGLYQVAHTALSEYVPFIILLLTLFTVTGGVHLSGTLVGRPAVNTAILLVGTLLASWMGTTGAAMLLIRPLIRANSHRKYKAHTMVFFIFLVANIGGCLTPFGDPPLFLGFLKGVSFFWTTQHLLLPFLLMSSILLGLYFLLDTALFKREGQPQPPAVKKVRLRVEGGANLLLLGAVVACVLASGMWQPGLGVDVFHVRLELQNILRDVLLLALAAASLKITTKELRHKNSFEWEPMQEVAKIFAGGDLRVHDSGNRHSAGRKRGRAGWPCGPCFARWRGGHGHVLLAFRRAFQRAGQRAHLSGFLQHRRGRRPGVDAPGAHPHGHFGGLGVHGGQLLHRQRAELHGAFHSGVQRRQDAELFWVHGLVARHPHALLRAVDPAVFPLVPPGSARLKKAPCAAQARGLFAWGRALPRPGLDSATPAAYA